ncbi:hypothetical protein QYM36_000624 [Artemia franciscana]|uniref:Phospholipid/glycerol acyltransferase domain-containing protein n=1 Tax=Artemia franciscana TaxID=6661 RepID=A0AA88IGA8_ARTSF|nr:hypothetical protein QYM36_000624 [Artemia franciscana]
MFNKTVEFLIILHHIITWIGFEDTDIDYLRWLFVLLSPLVAVFFLPAIILILLYISSILIVITKHHRRIFRKPIHDDPWDGCRGLTCAFWDGTSKFWHGYEVVGMENIPDKGGALLVFYHGALPIDVYYMVAKIYLYKERLVRSVADRFVFKTPGFGPVLQAFKVKPGTIQSCTEILEGGNLLAIAPGGVYEALLGDHYYELLWKNRIGFAKVAVNAKVPVIPVFTVNVRETFRSVQFFKNIWKWLYNRTRLPIVPIYGGFPVKLKTIVGKPIEHDPTSEPEELAEKVACAIKKIRDENQKIPGSIWRALLERL